MQKDSIHISNNLTIIIPAYNEEASVADTIESLLKQTQPPKKIIVVDDFSTDKTGEIATSYGVTVLTPPENTGSKAGAQNFALDFVDTDFTMAIDADTTLAPDAIEKLASALTHKDVAAACGFVIPRYTNTIWERGRYIEYLMAFTFYKPIQDYFGKPLISSGCFSIYRTGILKKHGGWPRRTMAEDMDLTWTFYEEGYHVRFIPEAVCYPIEPNSFTFMRKQLKRWSHGFIQNVRLHWKKIVRIQYLNTIVAVATWDAIIASFIYLIVLPILAIAFWNPWLLLGYIIDAPVVLVPVLLSGMNRGEIGKTLLSFPAFFVLRFVNAFFMMEAFWNEIIIGNTLTVYEKGH